MTIDVMNRLEKQFDWQLLEQNRLIDQDGMASYADVVQRCAHALEPLLRDWAKNTQSYMSDLCYELYAILAAAKEYDRQEEDARAKNKPISNKEHTLRMVGVRELGADHPEYIQCNLKSIPKGYYSGVYRITIQRMPAPRAGYRSTYEVYYRLYQGALKTEEGKGA